MRVDLISVIMDVIKGLKIKEIQTVSDFIVRNSARQQIQVKKFNEEIERCNLLETSF